MLSDFMMDIKANDIKKADIDGRHIDIFEKEYENCITTESKLILCQKYMIMNMDAYPINYLFEREYDRVVLLKELKSKDDYVLGLAVKLNMITNGKNMEFDVFCKSCANLIEDCINNKDFTRLIFDARTLLNFYNLRYKNICKLIDSMPVSYKKKFNTWFNKDIGLSEDEQVIKHVWEELLNYKAFLIDCVKDYQFIFDYKFK